MYTTPGCQPCARTRQWLSSKGIDFEVQELTTKEDFDSLGFTTVPVVATENGTWMFRDGLPKLKEMLGGE
jgi:glutaredoxin